VQLKKVAFFIEFLRMKFLKPRIAVRLAGNGTYRALKNTSLLLFGRHFSVKTGNSAPQTERRAFLKIGFMSEK